MSTYVNIGCCAQSLINQEESQTMMNNKNKIINKESKQSSNLRQHRSLAEGLGPACMCFKRRS